jgi:uncharacterized repeat protein (TIGR01451 family)
VIVKDVLPSGLTWVLPMPAGCGAAGQTVTCSLNPADLQVGESVAISLQALVGDITAATIFTNKAFVTTIDDPACAGEGCVPPCATTLQAQAVTGTNAANNVDCEDTPADVLTDVEIVKTTSTPSPIVGSTVTYTLTVTNNGPNVAHDVTVTDPMPAPMVLQSVSSPDFTCTSANNAITCTRAALQVNEVGVITVTALLPQSAIGGVGLLNTATVTTTTPETNLTNNVDAVTVIPVAVEVLAPTIPPPNVELPRTGADVRMMLQLAALLAAAGALTLSAARRRRADRDGAAD